MTIALAQDRRVWAWGKNDMGELGLGDAIDRDEPTVIPGLTNVSAIAAGKDFACALIVNEVWCWGNNGHGQVTDPPSNAAWTPTRVFSGATKLALGPEHTCILGTDEHVWCWGREEDGRLGDGIPNTKQQRSTSVGDLAKVSAGGRTTCAVGNNGVVYCWGDNRYGGLGLDVVLSTLVPTQVPGIPAAIDVVVSAKRACARTTDGNVWCWGESDNTPVSNGNPENPQKPSLAADLTGSDQVELSPYTTCAVFGDLLRCRGGNSLGQLGNGTTTPSTTLVDVVLPCPPAL
jgi:alpha-tubulin suppressor-like RCC1 family protein